MKFAIRPIRDPHRELDVTHRLVSAIAAELWQFYGGDDESNWLEAELHLRTIVSEARAEAGETQMPPGASVSPQRCTQSRPSDAVGNLATKRNRVSVVPAAHNARTPTRTPESPGPSRQTDMSTQTPPALIESSGMDTRDRDGTSCTSGYNMAPPTTQTILLIAGMRTIGCSEKISSALGLITGVTKAEVNFWSARATVAHRSTCSASQLIAAVMTAGYSASLAGPAFDGTRWSGNGIRCWDDDAHPPK